MWDELVAAFGLMLVLEGILPFLNPSSFRRTLQRIAHLDDHTVRLTGLGSMGLGLIVLYVFR